MDLRFYHNSLQHYCDNDKSDADNHLLHPFQVTGWLCVTAILAPQTQMLLFKNIPICNELLLGHQSHKEV